MIVTLELSSENAQVAIKLIGGFGPAPSEQVSKPHTPLQPEAQLISSEKRERKKFIPLSQHDPPVSSLSRSGDLTFVCSLRCLCCTYSEVKNLNDSTKTKILQRHYELSLAACQLPLVLMRIGRELF